MIRAHITSVFEFFRQPRPLLSTIVFTIGFLIFFLFVQNDRKHFAEEVPQILQVQPSVKKLASHVDVGLHINNFPEFSFRKNKFILDALVWFKFRVGTESLKTIEDFSFQNGQIISKSLPIIKVRKGFVTISYQTIAEFKTPLDYRFFPIDDHRLNITIENRRVTPNELCFNTSVHNLELSDDIFVSTWQPEKKIAQAGYIKSELGSYKDERENLDINYPCVTYTIEFANHSIRDLISLYFPMLILFFIGFFALLVDIRENTLRTSLISGAMPTLVLFRLVIDNIAPAASKITKVDYVYYILVFLASILLLFQVYVLLVQRKHKNSDPDLKTSEIRRLEKYNILIFAFVLFFLLTSMTYTHLL